MPVPSRYQPRRLDLSQSAVSRALQRLEQHLGTRILDRNSRTIRLTGSGKKFCQEVLQLLARLKEAAEETGRSSATVRGKLRVNVDPTFARLVLIPKLAAFLEPYPDLHLELAVREEVGDLISDGFDAAVRFGPPQPYALLVRRLLQVRVVTCAAPAFLQLHGEPRTPRDFETKRLPCLLFRDPITGEPYPREFDRGKGVVAIPISGRITMSDPITYLEACLAGLGVGQLFDLGTETFLSDGRLINLSSPGWTNDFPSTSITPPATQSLQMPNLLLPRMAGEPGSPGIDRKACTSHNSSHRGTKSCRGSPGGL
jgi:DNA-binding transcriptional LysR family regulator